jgi:hypothetical protein
MPPGRRPVVSNFAAIQAANRMHRQQMRLTILSAALVSNEQVDRLVDPLDDRARAVLLETGTELAELVDESRPIEDQLHDLRTYIDRRFDAIVDIIRPAQDSAIETWRTLLSQQPPPVAAEGNRKASNDLIAIVVLMTAAFATDLYIAEEGVIRSLPLLVGWLLLAFQLSIQS